MYTFDERELLNWRTEVLIRDGLKCMECGAEETAENPLCAHHIQPKSKVPELAYDVANGKTLCLVCHKKTDSYGWKGKQNPNNSEIIHVPGTTTGVGTTMKTGTTTVGGTTEAKGNSICRSVKWSKGFDELVNQYCQNNERNRNWMIKKAVGAMLGVAHLIPNSPEEDRDE